MAQAMHSDVEPDSDDSLDVTRPLVVATAKAGPEVGDLGVCASPAPKNTKKPGKHVLPLGVKPVTSGSQSMFALSPSTSGAPNNVNVAIGVSAAGEHTHFVDELAMQVTDGFQVVTSKKSKRQLNASSTNYSSDDDTQVKKRAVSVNAVVCESSDTNVQPSMNGNETLYIKGVGYNFAAAVRRQPSAYQADIIKCCGSDVDASLWKFSVKP